MPQNADVLPPTPGEVRPPFVLPPDLPTFAGRDAPLETLDRLLRPGGQAVIGIEGQIPGAGKSALAIHAAHRWRDRFPDGVIWADLRMASCAGDALRHVAGLYGRDEQAAQIGNDVSELAGLVCTILQNKLTLLIFDNAEGLPVDELAGLLPSVPGPTTVVTGWGALPALERLGQPLQVNAMVEDEALALLGCLMGQENVDAGRDACCELARRLNRLPLALDIAGRCARDQGWEPGEALRHLDEAAGRQALLAPPSAGTPENGVALAFALSYATLDADDQELFRALSPFAPVGVTPAALGVVLGRGEVSQVEAALDRLESRALTRRTAFAGRYDLHPLLHDYARALVKRAEEEEQWAKWHARYFATQADQSWRQSQDPGTASQAVAYATVERGNLVAAQQACLAHGLWNEAIHMAYRLDDIFRCSGHCADRRRTLQAGIDAARKSGLRRDEAGLAHNLGLLAQGQGDYAEARRLYEEALAITRQLDERGSVAVTLHNLGILAQKQGDLAEARRVHQQAGRAFERLGDHAGVARTLHQLGNVAYQQGDYAEARRQYGASLEIAQQLGDHASVASTACQIGMLAYLQGNVEHARRMYRKSLAIRRKTGDQRGIATNLHLLGLLAEDQGNAAEARRWYEEYLEMVLQLGDHDAAAQTLHRLGRMAEDDGDLEEAERLLAQSLALLETIGSPEATATRRTLDQIRARQADHPS